MNYIQKVFYLIVGLIFVSASLSIGCSKVSQNEKVVETQAENQELKSEIVSQQESAETPQYKNLKKQIKSAEEELTKVKNKQIKILEEFQPQSVEGREISAQVEAAEWQLNRLKSLADKEAAKFGRKPEYFPF